MYPVQLQHVIDQVLSEHKSNTPGAMIQLLVTAAIESRCGYFIRQLEDGPARGIFQMEVSTFNDLWRVVFETNIFKRNQLYRLCHFPANIQKAGTVAEYIPCAERLVDNLRFAIITARENYMRWSEPLPKIHDGKYNLEAIVDYYIKYWRPNPEKTTPDEAKSRAAYELGDYFEFSN